MPASLVGSETFRGRALYGGVNDNRLESSRNVHTWSLALRAISLAPLQNPLANVPEPGWGCAR